MYRKLRGEKREGKTRKNEGVRDRTKKKRGGQEKGGDDEGETSVRRPPERQDVGDFGRTRRTVLLKRSMFSATLYTRGAMAIVFTDRFARQT